MGITSCPYFTGFLIPGHIARAAAGIQQIEIAVAVHVDRAEVIGFLRFIEDMDREVPFPIVFIPGQFLTLVAATCSVEITIIIKIREDKAVR